MKKRIVNFLLRGTFFAGFGPIIYGIVLLINELCGVDNNLDGIVVFKAVISIYLMAFIIAGASIIWQEERLGIGLQIAIHASALYVSYLVTYLINGWLSSNLLSLGIFSAIFIGTYALIWLIIYIVEKNRAKRFNKQLV